MSAPPRLTRSSPVPPTPAPAVDFALTKLKGDDELLKIIHRMLYRTPGKATIIKKNIRAFSGFPDDTDRSKPRDLLTRAYGPTLNSLLDLFDLPRGSGEEGKKEAKIERIMAFLEKPEESGKKNLKEAAAAKREKAAAKREKVAAKKEKAAAKKAKAAGGKAAKLPSDAAAIKAELEKMAARQAALLKKLERAVEGGEKRKAPAAKATPTKKAKTSGEAAADGNGDAGMPSDEAIEAAVQEMLADADVDAISMKKVRADLEEKFGVPLVEKKAVIKEYVTAYVDSLPGARTP